LINEIQKSVKVYSGKKSEAQILRKKKLTLFLEIIKILIK